MFNESNYVVARRIATTDRSEILLAVERGVAGPSKLVAIKRVATRLLKDESFVTCFIDIMTRAASLVRPCVINIHDVHEEEEDVYAVMEYVSGESLEYVIRHADPDGIPVEIACRIASQIAKALGCVHDVKDENDEPLGVVHLDVNPTNIIIGYSGAPRLLDCATAKADPQDLYLRQTSVGSKLAYRSPEQLLHRSTDARSDVYSLGVVLYEMLVGRRLFRGPSPAVVVKSVIEMDFPKPSQLNTNVNPELDEVVLRAIARDPDRRTPTAQQLQDDLDRVLNNSRSFITVHDVGKWMTATLSERHAQRQEAERNVTVEAQADVEGRGPVELLPLFVDNHTGTATSQYTPNPLQNVPAAAPSPRPRKGERKATTWFLLGTGLTMVLVVLLWLAFWIGSRTSDRPRTGPEKQPVAQGDSPVADSPVALLVHVVPHGASIAIDGVVRVDSVGPDGALVPVQPKAKVVVKVQEQGYRPYVSSLTAPAMGTSHVYVNLVSSAVESQGRVVAAATPPREAAAVTVPGAPTATASPSSSADSKASTPRPRRMSRGRRAGRRGGRRPRSVSRPRPALLEVSFSPASAVLTIDGVVRPGRSPVLVAGLTPGRHTLYLSKEGHEPSTQQFQLEPGQKKVAMEVKLKRRIRQIEVEIVSAPVGAALRIDGKYQGNTPLHGFQLSEGKRYQVQLDLPGHRRWTGAFTPTAGNTRLTVTLNQIAVAKRPAPAPRSIRPRPPQTAPKGVGKLRVLSPNLYGEVWINGKKYGHPPLIASSIPAGIATVEIHVGGTVRRRKRVRVKKDTEARARFR